MSARRVVVIGGGLAGMSAALTLADAGAEVTLLESRHRLGGLTWSFSRHGLSFDNGQHVFLRCCSAYRQFLTRIGAADRVSLQPSLDIPVLSPGGIQSSITRGKLPAPLHLLPTLAHYRHLNLRDRVKVVRPALALRRLDPDDPSLDEVTFGSWLLGLGQSERSIARLWNLIALPTLNLPASEASLALAVKVFRTGLLDRADAGDLGWSTQPLSDLHGGHGGRALEDARVTTILDARVQSVSSSGSDFVVTTRAQEHVADAVIVATPPQVTRRLVPAGIVPSENALGRSPIVNVHLVLDRRVTDLTVAAVVDSPIQFVFDRTGSSGLRSGQCLSISLSAADAYMAQPSEQLVRFFFDALQSLFPEARQAELLDAVVTREGAATFRGVPGTAALRPSTRISVPGLYLAGAWCDTGWPDTMEGAVRSGQSAASACLEDAGSLPLTRLSEKVAS
jgi:squalene-associated FAD-dependent desaturase